ncbi:YfbK domain-containing protein [Aureliella helgolandensis]|uniref:von Willebrand factor n=1 Tax=Aureliella helgolandensis TaxID=2527968 RepID=A0A518GFT9_9BACT|nr:von Willebrand factor type A domain-containing protein [Aureliella helgolandensis]QDV27464.1 von Willebrand factor [Aureliella helgolandensis]
MSEKNKKSDPLNARPWKEWELTAYALGELDGEAVSQIVAAAQREPKLAAEIAAIRATSDHISQVYQTETPAGMGPERLSTIFSQAATSNAVPAEAAATPLPRKDASRKTAAIRRGVWFGVLGTAASLATALFFSLPQMFSPLALQETAPRSADDASSSPALPRVSSSPVSDAHESLASKLASNEGGTGVEDYAASTGDEVVDEYVPRYEAVESEELDAGTADLARNSTKDSAGLGYGYGGDAMGMGGGGYGGMMGGGGAGGMMGSGGYGLEAATPENAPNPNGIDASGIPGANAGPGGRPVLSKQLYGDKGYMSDDARLSDLTNEDEASKNFSPFFSGSPNEPAMPALGLPQATESEGRRALQRFGWAEIVGRESRLSTGEAKSVPEGFSRYRKQAAGYRRYDPRGGMLGENFPDGNNTDRYQSLTENAFQRVDDAPLSTLSIDVDTASFVKARQLLLEAGRLPPPDAVRIEEFINYFEYEYAGPHGDDPFGADLAVANCPWAPEHKLVRIALQATKVDLAERPKANIVFLLDVSGSMDEPNKLPLVKESIRMLVEQLGENDRVAMVVYAGAAGCVLESTRGDQQEEILGALQKLSAGGSTNGGQGIELAYNLARDHFIPGGINRVVLCTDGDFNVGVTSTNSLVELVEENAKGNTFLTVLGFGMGNTNDAMMEQISNRGNGVYGFVDSRREAHRQMVRQLAGNLMTVAKDVKIQVEFNPTKVQEYRLLGYENRIMAAADFNNDKKDAGEIGAGHRVTALYEIVPIGDATGRQGRGDVDELRYQPKSAGATVVAESTEEASSELLAVKLRYKQPEGNTSKLLMFPLEDQATDWSEVDRDFQWAAAMAEFGMLLRNSPHRGKATWSSLSELSDAAAGVNPDGSRQECLQMIRRASQLSGNNSHPGSFNR